MDPQAGGNLCGACTESADDAASFAERIDCFGAARRTGRTGVNGRVGWSERQGIGDGEGHSGVLVVDGGVWGFRLCVEWRLRSIASLVSRTVC